MSDAEDDFEDDPELGDEETLPVGQLDIPLEERKTLDEDEDEVEDEEKEKQAADNPLVSEVVADNLTLLMAIGDGLGHAYVRLELHEKLLTEIEILKNYIHLRFIDISRNLVKSISGLSALSHLLVLKADQNNLISGKLDPLPFVQNISLMRNKIKSTEGLNHPMLVTLTLNFNEIPVVSGLDPDMLKNLTTLELRNNKLTSTEGLAIPSLKSLFLGGNQLTKLQDLEGLVNLTTLHIRDNAIENLSGFAAAMGKLSYINMRTNAVSTIAEIKKLAVLPALKAISLADNPIGEEDEYRIEVLVAIPHLARLDKDEYMEDEHSEATELVKSKERAEAEALAAKEMVEETEADAEAEEDDE